MDDILDFLALATKMVLAHTMRSGWHWVWAPTSWVTMGWAAARETTRRADCAAGYSTRIWLEELIRHGRRQAMTWADAVAVAAIEMATGNGDAAPQVAACWSTRGVSGDFRTKS